MSIDVFGKDDEIDNLFRKISGPKDETSTQFLRRLFTNACKGINQPKRIVYSTGDLTSSRHDDFLGTEFTIQSSGNRLNCVIWKKSSKRESDPARSREGDHLPLIVYLHANRRSLVSG